MGQSIQEWTTKNLWKATLKKLKVIWSASADRMTLSFLKAVFFKFYLVYS